MANRDELSNSIIKGDIPLSFKFKGISYSLHLYTIDGYTNSYLFPEQTNETSAKNYIYFASYNDILSLPEDIGEFCFDWEIRFKLKCTSVIYYDENDIKQ